MAKLDVIYEQDKSRTSLGSDPSRVILARLQLVSPEVEWNQTWLGKSKKLWDMYLDQALFACRVRTHDPTKTSPFYLVCGKHPRLLGDHKIPLASDAKIVDNE